MNLNIMKKIILIVMASLIITSCNSQTDLETLKTQQDISEVIKEIKNMEKTTDADYGLATYDTEDLQNFKFGDISLSKYSMPDGYSYSVNSLSIHVDEFGSNKFLGVTINIVKKDEAEKMLLYLTEKYGTPNNRETAGNGKALFWNVSKSKKWIFFTTQKDYTRKNSTYTSTKIMIIEEGIRVGNSKDNKTFTILDSFNLSFPKTE
jgi:hypothetical protein